MNEQVFRKLRLKIVLIGIAMMVVLMLAVCISVYFAMAESLKSNSLEVLNYTAEFVESELRNDSDNSSGLPTIDDSPLVDAPETLDTLLLRNVLIVRHDGFGFIIQANQGARVIDHVAQLGSQLPDIDFYDEPIGVLELKDTAYRYKHITVGNEQFLLLINRSGELANLPSLIAILLVVGTGAIIALLIACFALAGHIIRPISEAWNTQQQFLHDASHELKTPLAVIATNIEAVRGAPDETVASQDKWLRYAAEETSQMQKMVNYMLALAKSDNPDSELRDRPHVPFSLSDTVTEAGLITEATALEAGIELDVQVEEDLWTVGIQLGIKHVLLILLDNAVKNTFAGGKITLELHQSRTHLIISCTNTGHGIPADELQNIFKRFYRVDPSRARQSGGNGLGLSIAESIVRVHGGKIWAESEVGSYARFLVRLPAANAPSKH